MRYFLYNHLTRSLRLSHAVFAIACCVLYIWVNSNIQPRFIIRVDTDPSIYELTRVVREQQQMIDYLSKHPKIVFRCPDDEPTIKYPKQATDDLTSIVLDTTDGCGDTPADAVMIVHTAADHFDRRGRFRRTYSNFTNTSPYRIKVVFLIGQVESAELSLKLERENMEFGDTVLGVFLDTYHNLTLKAVMGYRWLNTTCKDVKMVIKMDDDVFLDVRKFFNTYWNKLSNSVKTNSIHCQVWEHAVVGRTGKWKVERGLFPNSSYPFPYCAGFFAIVTPDLIKQMYSYGKKIDFFWIDDVFLYGMVPAAIRGVHFNQVGRKKRLITDSYMDYSSCVKKRGHEGCPFWAVLTDGRDQFDAEYSSLFQPKRLVPLNNTETKNSSKVVKDQPKPVMHGVIHIDNKKP
ncbi:beta-1,3-galactosyltransferase 5-like isoform X3 [Biomphalaria glabrata]|uniref:Hexosyltransferase n=1 Tax=Biomphalaria glabrata TaxID=6526 RepID=A0A9W2ZP93_BIOGL|nr:beta-1,3-galactosyltransferase 5-like isoform X3 [Biomphalaria glabrata]